MAVDHPRSVEDDTEPTRGASSPPRWPRTRRG